MSELQLDIISLNDKVFSGTVHHLAAPSYQGDFEIYRNHCALIGLLCPGQIKLSFVQQNSVFYYVSGGILEVCDNAVLILADTVIKAEDINEAEVLMVEQESDQLLRTRGSNRNYGALLTKVAQARAKLRTLKSHGRFFGRERL